MIVAFTGHRPPKVGGYYAPNPVQTEIRRLMWETLATVTAGRPGPHHVLSGMALGVDQWAAEMCCDNGISWTAVVPYRGFGSNWPAVSQAHFQTLLNRANHVRFVSESETYSPIFLHRRNAWMVDNCDRIIAVWDGTPGGTASCLEYAARRRRPITYVPVPAEIWDEARAMAERRERYRTSRATPTRAETNMQPLIAPTASRAVTTTEIMALAHQVHEEFIRTSRVPREFFDPTLSEVQSAITPFIGAVNNNGTALAIAQRLDQVFAELRDRFAGPDQTVQHAQQVGDSDNRDATAMEVTNEKEATEKRFRPGRVIDID